MLTIDSNILVYALDTRDADRCRQARDVILQAAGVTTFLTQQVIGEFCNVALRNRLLTAAAIGRQIDSWSNTFPIVPTAPAQLAAAARLAETRRKQFWDMVIVAVAADAEATMLLTEDVGDGEVIAGVRIIDPFNPANAPAIRTMLTPSS